MEKRLPAGNLSLRTLIFCSDCIIELGKGCICCQVRLTGALGADADADADEGPASVKGLQIPDESKWKRIQKMFSRVPPKEKASFPVFR